jgi:hypothetical protein
MFFAPRCIMVQYSLFGYDNVLIFIMTVRRNVCTNLPIFQIKSTVVSMRKKIVVRIVKFPFICHFLITTSKNNRFPEKCNGINRYRKSHSLTQAATYTAGHI